MTATCHPVDLPNVSVFTESLCPLQRKREAADSDSEAVTTPNTPSADDVKKDKKKKKKEKMAKLDEVGQDGASAEPEEVAAEPETEVSMI